MDAEENQRQVSLRAHSPWKSPTTRFPHSHSRDDAVEKWKANTRLPTFPLPDCSLSRIRNQKGGLAADRFAPAFRLILQ
jgi:hypothetical protein